LNRASPKHFQAGTRRRAALSRSRARPRRAVPASTSGTTQPHPEVRPFPRSRVPRTGALQGASKSREPRAAPRFALRAPACAARWACRCPRSGGCARPCFEAKPLRRHAGARLFKALSRVTSTRAGHLHKPAAPPCPPRPHARRAAMPAASTSSASTRPAGRSAFPAPHLGPKEAHRPAPCPAPPFPSPDGQPQRATPPRAAEGHHRRLLPTNRAPKSNP
jgi:hypothetical protein